ncbi:hypothetical protein V2J09_005486 [Rumex salicifolius]
MAAGNPNWHIMQQQSNIHSNSSLFSLLHHQLSLHGGSPNNSSSSSSSSSSKSSSSSSTSSLPSNSLIDEQSPHQQPWSQIIMSEEESLGLSTHLQGMNPSPVDHPKATLNNENMLFSHGDDEYQFIKQEVYGHGGHEHGHGHHDMSYHDHEAIHHQMADMRSSTWSHMVLQVSSPKSCVTNLSDNYNHKNNTNNFMDFSSSSCKDRQHAQYSFESNSQATTGSAPKKPRVQSSSIPPLKVRKEKLGDRITALHQLVSPFGKTDTASVLIETIGCIRFLQGQIQALSSPYLGIPPSKNHHFNYVAKDESPKELRSRGLCLVPISFAHFVGTDNNTAAEYWAPSLAGGF